jgi:uncharacterized integral membrane protein
MNAAILLLIVLSAVFGAVVVFAWACWQMHRVKEQIKRARRRQHGAENCRSWGQRL